MLELFPKQNGHRHAAGWLVKAFATVTISGDLIENVRALYQLAVREISRGRVSQHGLNAYTDYALSSYILCVAAVEAFVNEALLSDQVAWITGGSALWRLRREWLERLELRDKLILVTQLLFGEALDPGKQPLQDFVLLLKVRNEVVHYKRGAPPKFINEFVARGLALSARFREEHPDAPLAQPWAWDLQCTEGIRWAHNTACRIAQDLAARVPAELDEYTKRHGEAIAKLEDFQFLRDSLRSQVANFEELSELAARSLFRSLGVDPERDSSSK